MSNTQYVPRLHKKRPTIRMGEVLSEEWETSPDSTAPLTDPFSPIDPSVTVGAQLLEIPGAKSVVSAVGLLKYVPVILAGTALFAIYVYVSSYGKATARITHPFG